MNCVPNNYDITIYEGGTYDKIFRWLIGTPALPMDLSGCTGVMQGRKKLSDTDPLISLPFVATPWVADGLSGIYVLDDGIDPDTKGYYRMYIKDEDTTGLCASHKNIEGVYNLYLYNTLGEAILDQYGIMNIQASALRTV